VKRGDRVRWHNKHFRIESDTSRAAAWRTGEVQGVTASGKVACVRQDGREGGVIKRVVDLQVI